MTAAGPPLLTTEGLVVGYVPGANVLDGVDVVVAEGEMVAIVGPNGAGKSTLIKAICGLVPARAGRVLFGTREVTGAKPHQIVRGGVGYVPQLDNVFRSMTVEENLELSAMPFASVSFSERRAAMFELFPALQRRRRQAAGVLSGGERQMLAMAKALVPEPRLLLLDEPSAGVAPAYVDLIFDKVGDINRAGVSVMMVEQNARRALECCDRGYVLDGGRNRFHGPGNSLLDDPRVVELYLGGTARIDHAGEPGSRPERVGPD